MDIQVDSLSFWRDARELTLGGLGWRDDLREHPWDRIPARVKPCIPDGLWNLFTQPAGVYIEFRTNARTLALRWRMPESWPYSPTMAGVGVSGFDLYGRDGSGSWRWAGNLFTGNKPEGNGTLNRLALDGVDRIYRIYFPLRRRVFSLEVGSDASLEPAPADVRPPIAYYGTSIVHGEGAGRAGTAHAARLGRALDREFLNLGVCGSARCEPAVAEALAELHVRLFLIDVLPNNSAEEVEKRLPEFLHILRQKHPTTPIVFLGDRVFGDAAFVPERAEVFAAKNQSLTNVFDAACRKGDDFLHLRLEPDWYGEDGEGTIDASHPNDLGAARMAARLLPVLSKLLDETPDP